MTIDIIHLSDLHIGKSKMEEDNTKELFRFIAKNLPHHIVLITGDLTNDGTQQQIYTAYGLISELSKSNPVFAVPGNHDYARIGLFFKEEAKDTWRSLLWEPMLPNSIAGEFSMPEDGANIGVYVLDSYETPVALIGLDTADPLDEEFLARGRWTYAQSKRLEQILLELRESIRVVFFHHHPFLRDEVLSIYDTFPLVESLVLDGAEMLIDSLKGRCELVLFGHKHVENHWEKINGISNVFACNKSTQPDSQGMLYFRKISIQQSSAENSRELSIDWHHVFLPERSS